MFCRVQTVSEQCLDVFLLSFCGCVVLACGHCSATVDELAVLFRVNRVHFPAVPTRRQTIAHTSTVSLRLLYMYTCKYMYIHTYTRTHEYIQIRTHICTHIRMYVYLFTSFNLPFLPFSPYLLRFFVLSSLLSFFHLYILPPRVAMTHHACATKQPA